MQTLSADLEGGAPRAFGQQRADASAARRWPDRGEKSVRLAEAQAKLFELRATVLCSLHSIAQAKVPPVLMVSIP